MDECVFGKVCLGVRVEHYWHISNCHLLLGSIRGHVFFHRFVFPESKIKEGKSDTAGVGEAVRATKTRNLQVGSCIQCGNNPLKVREGDGETPEQLLDWEQWTMMLLAGFYSSLSVPHWGHKLAPINWSSRFRVMRREQEEQRDDEEVRRRPLVTC